MKFTRSPRRVFTDAITRREALRYLAAATGAAALGPSLIGCGDGDHSATVAPLMPEELDIESVVVVMMENRSFDHFLGSLSLVERRPVDGLTAGLANPRPDGSMVPIFQTGMRCVEDPPHGWDASHRQVDGGANDGFVREYYSEITGAGLPPQLADEVMGYFTRSQIPIHYALADEFALCQRWFAAVRGPTWPNRMYLHSAQSNGQINNDFPSSTVGWKWQTIYDRVGDAGLDWKSYYTDLPFLYLWGRLRLQMEHFAPIDQFFDDARSGRLAPLVHVEPSYLRNDDHPPHDIELGQAFLSSVLHAIAEGPQWQRTMVILTYDEHGGFFDHVAPPTVPDERADLGFGQLGVRVPGLVISPYSKRGLISSTVYEHSSVPAFVEWLYGLPPLTVRDANANYFLDTFDLRRIRNHDPRPFPTLPMVEADPDVPPECERFGGGFGLAVKQDIEQFADAGGIPAELDRRAEVDDTLRRINRELIRMGKARPVRNSSR